MNSSSRNALVALLFCLLFFTGAACRKEQKIPVQDGMKNINGTRLYTKVIGTGEPVVIIHGGPGMDHSYFLPQMMALAKDYRLIFFDQRVSGRSAKDVDSTSITMKQFVDDIEGIRRAFKLDRMNLMGHSWGGLLAMVYASRYPDRVKSLLLVNPIAASSEYQAEALQTMNARFTREDSVARSELSAALNQNPADVSLYEKLFRLNFRANFFHRNFIDSLTLDFQPDFLTSSEKLRYLFKDLPAFNFYPELAKIAAPTLILHGAYDSTPKAAIERLRATIPQATLVYLENCGHFPFVECPEKFFATARAFLQQDAL